MSEGKIPDVRVEAEVPQDFEVHAQKLGYTATEMLWLLAENLCANPPGRISIVRRGPALPQSTAANVVPFPLPPKPGNSSGGFIRPPLSLLPRPKSPNP